MGNPQKFSLKFIFACITIHSLYPSKIYCTLQIVRGGKLSSYAELNCDSLENFCG